MVLRLGRRLWLGRIEIILIGLRSLLVHMLDHVDGQVTRM